jgi:predicted CoA-binding protein
MTSNDPIDAFLDGDSFAVVGASTDRMKYGNKVLRAYVQRKLMVYPVNPRAEEIEGLKAYRNLAELPTALHGVSFVTSPAVTLRMLEEACELGIQHVWMQPGAESPEAVQFGEAAGMNVIAGGPCILVRLGYRES